MELKLFIEDSKADLFLNILKSFKDDIVRDVRIIDSNHKSGKKSHRSSDSKSDAFGIIKDSDIDPVQWQESLRSENDSDLSQ